MAEITTKTISDLSTDSTLSDDDAFVYGDGGGNTLKKSKLSLLKSAILGALPSTLTTTAETIVGAINELNTNLTAAVAKNANSTKFYMGTYLYSGTSTNNVTIYIPSGYSAAIATAQNSGGIYVTYVSVSGTTMVINLNSATTLIQLNYILI